MGMSNHQIQPPKSGRPALPLGALASHGPREEDRRPHGRGLGSRPDGKRRQITASGKTKGAALRNLQRRLDDLVHPTPQGMQPNWTISRGVRHWRKRPSRSLAADAADDPSSRRHSQATTPRSSESSTPRWVKSDSKTSPSLSSKDFSGALEQQGISTERARDVLNGTFNLAARDDAVRRNPMPYVALPAREPKEVEALDVVTARFLLRAVHRDYKRTRGKRRPNATFTMSSRSASPPACGSASASP